MEREMMNNLVAWKESRRRKPLLLTGVRQCGKTHILKEFGQRYFLDTLYINFESDEKLSDIFTYDFDIKRILRELEYVTGHHITVGQTLVIFDEIQECPKAITSLKYFCEEARELHLVCAGSLLGVALKEENVSFPVGKVNRMTMYPMNFREFVLASAGEKILNMLADWPLDRPLPELYSVPLENLLAEYYAVGGMPEAVLEWIEHHDREAVDEIQSEILSGYADDFSKHAPVKALESIRLVWKSVPEQLAKDNHKFIFSHVKAGKRAAELEGSLQWLLNAGLIYMLPLVKNAESPLSAYADETFFKVYMSDVGLLRRRAGIPWRTADEWKKTAFDFKGALAENYVMNELNSMGLRPYFWLSGNTAELDFLFESDGRIVPVEVKSADNTQAKSYARFCTMYHPEKGFKCSMKNIAVNDCNGTRTISLPLYMLWTMKQYLTDRE